MIVQITKTCLCKASYDSLRDIRQVQFTSLFEAPSRSSLISPQPTRVLFWSGWEAGVLYGMVLRKQSRVIRPVTKRPSETLSEPIDSRRAIGNAQVLRSSEISLPENEDKRS